MPTLKKNVSCVKAHIEPSKKSLYLNVFSHFKLPLSWSLLASIHAVASAEIDTCQRTSNLAVLIAVWRTPQTQHFVDNWTHKTGKNSLTWDISPKGVVFSDFICTFDTSLMILLVVKRITNVSKNLTQQNPEQFFAAQELISNVKLKCCGI